MDPEELVDLALAHGAEIVTSTYNEPLITSEWAVEVFKVAKACGLLTAYVVNGGGTLYNVLATLRGLVERGFWLEVVTLIVPGFNDSDVELGGIAEFLASLSLDIPWHVTAFHPDYKMSDRDFTSADTLLRAVQLGHAAGL